MNHAVVLAALILIVGSSSLKSAQAQTTIKDKLPGVWEYVAAYTEFSDKTRRNMFGDHPHGYFIIDRNGHYSHIVMTRGRKPTENGTMRGNTPDEVKTAAECCLSHFGEWSVNEQKKQFTVHIEGSSFPNFEGIDQVRQIEQLDDDTLKYANAVSSSGFDAVVYAVLRRLK